MKCEMIQATLRERFDAGLDRTAGFETHLASCESCRHYDARLRELDESFALLTDEAPAPDLAARIQRRIGAEAVVIAPRRIGVGVAAALTAAAALGWVFPLSADFESWWQALRRDALVLDWSSVFPFTASQAWRVWEGFTSQLDHIARFSSATVWASLAAALILLVVFNGAEAASVRVEVAPRRYRAAK